MYLKKVFSLLLLFLFVAAIVVYVRERPIGVVESFENDLDHFRYGSIGSDNPFKGLPYWIWKVLPDMYPHYLPATGKRGYEAFGFIVEPGRDRPIGFSKRRLFNFVDLIGPNCALCHVSTIRATPTDHPHVVVGMPAHTVDLEKFYQFLFRTASEPDFTIANVMKHIENVNPKMGFFHKLAYRPVIFLYRWLLRGVKDKFDFLGEMPAFGPGRVETWTPYKRSVVNRVLRVSAPGIADFPSIWNQKARLNHALHWDGNNGSIDERNRIAAVGIVGTHLQYLDLKSLERIKEFIIQLQPPKYEETKWIPPEYKINQDLAQKGRALYVTHCAYCHDSDGKRFGSPLAIDELGTDRNRLDSFTEELASELNEIRLGSRPLFKNFKKTYGYVSMLLDGVWLRAPYLHNGSVPTLRDLLNKPAQRPKIFYRGNDLYDWVNIGFKSDAPKEQHRKLFPYSTAIDANSNGGHDYGTDLRDDEKIALIEYLKTL